MSISTAKGFMEAVGYLVKWSGYEFTSVPSDFGFEGRVCKKTPLGDTEFKFWVTDDQDSELPEPRDVRIIIRVGKGLQETMGIARITMMLSVCEAKYWAKVHTIQAIQSLPPVAPNPYMQNFGSGRGTQDIKGLPDLSDANLRDIIQSAQNELDSRNKGLGDSNSGRSPFE